jgi:hypothetical protein
MAARKITLQFGLLSVAAKSEVAITRPPTMSNLCSGQPGKPEHEHLPVQAPKQCAKCGPITDYDTLSKGIKTGSTYTLVDKEAIGEAREEYSGQYKDALSLVAHPAEQFLTATGPGDTLHYLTPADAGAADHYQLLTRLVAEHPELAFAGLYTPSSATALFRLTVREGVLCLEKRARQDNVKPAPSVGGVVNDALYAALDGMLPSLLTDYDPAAYEDKYGQALDAMLAEGETVALPGKDAPAVAAKVSDDDLIAQMQKLAKGAKKK